MKNQLTFLTCIYFLFHSVCLFSQKKDYYYDRNNDLITKKLYNKLVADDIHFLPFKTVNDTANIYFLEKRSIEDRLSLEKYNEIITYLNSISSKKTDSTKVIIIDYYPGKDECNSGGNKEYAYQKDLEYYKKLNSRNHVDQYFIAKSLEGIYNPKNILPYILDKDHLIENTFFRLHYPCGSFVIIYPSKEYFLFKGEYDLNQILSRIDN